jgi:amidase
MSAAVINYRTATELLKLLAGGRISASELLEENLARMRKVNPLVNAVVALDEDGARKAARNADEARVRGAELGPLHGLSMTIKDTFEVVGMTATCGLEALRDYRPAADAAAVARLRRAGAIFFGKTNLPPAAADHQSCNSLFGLTGNPWNAERTVGGSSGGSAGALAAGMTPLELGSDIGGSIRVPAHFCGVYGHKPSYGIVPAAGHIPPPPGHLSQPELAVAGPIARSAFDLELMLDIITDAPELEQTAFRINLPPARRDDLRDFRVAVWNDALAYSLDDAYAAAIDALIDDLRRLSVKVDAEARPAIDPAQSFRTYMQTLFGVIGADFPPLLRDAIVAEGKASPDGGYPRIVADAVSQSHAEFAAAAEQREHLFRAWRDFFTRYDVLLCPITPTVAFPHDVARLDLAAQFERRINVNGKATPYMDNLMWPGLVTVANLPATAMPTRRFVDGLPAGVQIVGPYLEDRTTLRFTQLVEREFGGFMPPPL